MIRIAIEPRPIMPELPPEILDLVLDEIRQPLDARSMKELGVLSPAALLARYDLQFLMLTSRAFSILTRQHLYRKVHLTFGHILRGGERRSLRSLAEYLRSHPHIASSVISLTLCKQEAQPYSPDRCKLAELSEVLQLFPRLRTLGLCNVKLTDELPGSFSIRPMPLETFQMWTWPECEAYDAKDIGGILTTLASVKALHIEGLRLLSFHNWDFFGTPASLQITESLQLNPLHRPGAPGVALTYLSSVPNAISNTITTIAIRDIGSDDLEPVLKFVKAVSQSLRVVELGFVDGSLLPRTVSAMLRLSTQSTDIETGS